VKKYHLLGSWVKGSFKRRSIQAHALGILAVSLLDEKYVATGSADRTAKLFDLRTGLCLRTFTGHLLPVGCLQLGESKLITGSADTTIKIWSLRDEQCHFTLR
jgi:WD40 repeat protein